MKLSSAAVVMAAAAAAAGIGVGAVHLADGAGESDGKQDRSVRVTNPSAAARTSFPDLTPATGEPQLAGFADVRPAPGDVAQVVGPFDDRFVLTDLKLDDGAVSGAVEVTSDVSELLELQVLAGFYDSAGRLLGTRRFVHHFVEEDHRETGPPVESQPFTVEVPLALRNKAVSAAVGVPVLVNE